MQLIKSYISKTEVVWLAPSYTALCKGRNISTTENLESTFNLCNSHCVAKEQSSKHVRFTSVKQN